MNDLLDDDFEGSVSASHPTASGVPIPFLTPRAPLVPTLEGALICTEKEAFPKFLFVTHTNKSQNDLPVHKTEVYARMADLPKELQALVRKALWSK